MSTQHENSFTKDSITLREFRYATYALRFREPLALRPVWSSRYWVSAEHKPLGIDIWGGGLVGLSIALQDELDVLWRNYGRADDAVLAPDAQALKRRLLEAIEEVKW